MGKVSKVLEKSGYIDNKGDSTSLNNSIDSPDIQQSSEQNLQDSSQSLEEKFISQEEARVGWDERLDSVNTFSSHLSESFRMLRSRILYPDDASSPPKTIMVTSAAPLEGKSFVAANLGIVIAQGVDQNALLIGCDLRKPTLAKLFGMSGRYGLSDYLQDKDSLDKLIQPTGVEGLSLLPAGRPPANPAELLGSEKMKKLFFDLASRYDDRIIVFDSPPMQSVSETLVLSKQVDGVVLVVRWGGSDRIQVKKLVENIGRKKIIGIVFNAFRVSKVEAKYFGYYGEAGYGKYGKYGKYE